MADCAFAEVRSVPEALAPLVTATPQGSVPGFDAPACKDFSLSRSILRTMKPAANVIVVCLLLLLAGISVGQTRKRKMVDAAVLRARLVAAFDQDFELLKDEFKARRGGGIYWLAHLKPKRAGRFYLRHTYKDPHENYSHTEQEIRVGVSPQSCRRGLPFAATYTRICLGDTIIFPVDIDDFTRHQFKLIRADYPNADSTWKTFDDPRPEIGGPGFDRTPIANPVDELLRYEGSYSVESALAYPGYTLQWYAVFEAMKPGRFNLEVTAANASSTVAFSTQPIIVVEPGAPVTVLAAWEELRFFSKGRHGQEWRAGSSGNSYVTDLMILQPGDRISLPYHTFTRNLQYEGRHGTGIAADPTDIKPVIIVHPFSLNLNYNINEWVVGFLPK